MKLFDYVPPQVFVANAKEVETQEKELDSQSTSSSDLTITSAKISEMQDSETKKGEKSTLVVKSSLHQDKRSQYFKFVSVLLKKRVEGHRI